MAHAALAAPSGSRSLHVPTSSQLRAGCLGLRHAGDQIEDILQRLEHDTGKAVRASALACGVAGNAHLDGMLLDLLHGEKGWMQA